MTEAVEQLRAAASAALSDDPASLSPVEVMSALITVECVRRQLDALDAGLIAAISERRLEGAYGAASVTALVAQQLHVSPREAAARVRRAGDLGPRRTLVGEPLPPILPTTAVALARGELSSEHVRVISKTLDALPPDVSLETSQRVEALLVDAAEHADPPRLSAVAQVVSARLDPEGREPEEEREQRRRGLNLGHGSQTAGKMLGDLTGQATAVWTAILDALSKPLPAADGTPDERSATQRRHDALLDAGLRLLRSGTLPDSGGTPVTVLVHVDVADVGDSNALAVTDHGQLVSMRQLIGLCGESALLPHMFDSDGEVLDRGRTVRLATVAQRHALAARDHGCVFPGCTRPAAWTEVHHVVPWQHGGPTDLDNLVLLCGHHHRHVDTLGWHLFMHHGLPYWTPPAWLDPDQQPVRNTAQHPPDIYFDPLEQQPA